MAKNDKAPEKAEMPKELPSDDVRLRANYRKAVYVSCEGDQLDAKMIPLPARKGRLTEIPVMLEADIQREQARIAQLPLEKRLNAQVELTKSLAKGRPALAINGGYMPLVKLGNDLFHEAEFQGAKVACADLLINLNTNREGTVENWQMACKVIHKDHVGSPAKGARGKAHFYLA